MTYDSMNGHYIFYTKYGEIQFNKDGMGLPYIDAKQFQDVAFVQIVRKILEASPRKISPQLNSLVNAR